MRPKGFAWEGVRFVFRRCVGRESLAFLAAVAAVLSTLCPGGCAQLPRSNIMDSLGLFDDEHAIRGKRIPIPPTVKDFESPGGGEDAPDHSSDDEAVRR